MGLDTRLKTWKWPQWLALFGLIQCFVVLFGNVYVYALGIPFRITFFLFITILFMLYNFLYVLGFFVDLDRTRYLITMAIPFGLILLDLAFFYFLGRAVPAMAVYYISFLFFLISYLVYCGTLFLCYQKIEITYADLSEKELYELGVIDEDPDRVIGGVAVAPKTKSRIN